MVANGAVSRRELYIRVIIGVLSVTKKERRQPIKGETVVYMLIVTMKSNGKNTLRLDQTV